MIESTNNHKKDANFVVWLEIVSCRHFEQVHLPRSLLFAMAAPLYENLEPLDGFAPPDVKTAIGARSPSKDETSAPDLKSISELNPRLMKLLYENENPVVRSTFEHIERNTGLQREHVSPLLLLF